MPIYQDQMNRNVDIPSIPKRIVSLVPSQTELLFDLGLDEELIGITKFCIHPQNKIKQKLKVGGTKNLDINLIKGINPDLIIGNKEENERSHVEELMRDFPVWMSDIADLKNSMTMIKCVGKITGKSGEADKLITSINNEFEGLKPLVDSLRVAYFIWRKPYMVAGKRTFIDDMLQKCGLTNAIDKERYPELTPDKIVDARPDVILLSSEPYPFRQKHVDEFKSLLPRAKVKLVDGEMFSWYGSRLLHAPGYFKSLLNDIKSVK